MQKLLSINIMIDAMGWEILGRHAFCQELAPVRKQLGSVFGYSSACVPSILSGHWPDVAIFQRNLRLMGIRLWDDEDFKGHPIWADIMLQTRIPPTVDLDQFTSHCKFNGLPSIGNQMPEWVIPIQTARDGMPGPTDFQSKAQPA